MVSLPFFLNDGFHILRLKSWKTEFMMISWELLYIYGFYILKWKSLEVWNYYGFQILTLLLLKKFEVMMNFIILDWNSWKALNIMMNLIF